MRELVDTALPIAGPTAVGLALAAWCRYVLIRFGEDEQVAGLRLPLLASGLLLVVLVAAAVTDAAPR